MSVPLRSTLMTPLDVRIKFMIYLRLCFIVLAFVFLFGCRGEEKGRQWAEALRPLSLVLQNGEAGVLRTDQGFVLVVPEKTDVSEGEIAIYVSQSDNPTDWRLVGSMTMTLENLRSTFDFQGAVFNIGGGSKDSVNLSLDFLDHETEITKIDVRALNEINPEDLEFRTSPNNIDQVVDEMLDDVGRRNR